MLYNIDRIEGKEALLVERIEKQLKFIMEIDKLKKIVRQSYITDASRKETDSDHSWHLAMMAIILREYSNEEVDILKVITMVLIHDIVEIDAGDTYAYDNEGNKTKREREVKAAERIFGILPADQSRYMRELWEEFERADTPESKFANTLDKVQPAMLNAASGGMAWREHEVCLSQVIERNTDTHKGSEELWKFAERLILEHVEKGNIKRD